MGPTFFKCFLFKHVNTPRLMKTARPRDLKLVPIPFVVQWKWCVQHWSSILHPRGMAVDQRSVQPTSDLLFHLPPSRNPAGRCSLSARDLYLTATMASPLDSILYTTQCCPYVTFIILYYFLRSRLKMLKSLLYIYHCRLALMGI